MDYLELCTEFLNDVKNIYGYNSDIPLKKKCLQWTKKYWNEGEDIYAHVIPEFLLEFDNYRETNEKELVNSEHLSIVLNARR